MQYMLLIFEDETIMQRATEEKGFEAYMAPWMRYTEELREAGALIGGEPLEAGHTASVVSLRGGKRQVQDGPYIDTKEQLGGYYMIEAASLDEALTWAEKCPASATGFIEVRPVADLSG